MNKPKSKMKLFEHKQVRTVWDEEAEKWWFSVIYVISVLADSYRIFHYFCIYLGNLAGQLFKKK